MSCDQSYPFPQVFLVDEGSGHGGRQHPSQSPNLIPCWSFPPPQERTRARGKSRGCMGVSHSAALVVLMLFLLVFAALGLGFYQIYNMQQELKGIETAKPANEFYAAQKQIGHYEPEVNREDKDEDRPAAHVIGLIEKRHSNTLRWDPRTGQAFTSGGVVYQSKDGALQVNETGLFHVYSRVELIFKECDRRSTFDHSVFVRRAGVSLPVTLMVSHRASFCSKHPERPWTTESYLGSIQQLQKHDRVYVNISQPNALSHSHYANFFGLYKI